MGKIKLKLLSGAVIEKPLVSTFKANNNSYVILDNEVNGSMGLPIILVSKLVVNKLTKIVDQNEWQIVKEYLKNIIAGNKLEYINIGNELFADDIYYTQLTLPVPSFDILKRAYTESGVDGISGGNTLNVPPTNPTEPVQQTSVVPPVPPVGNMVPPVPPMPSNPVPEPTVDINMINPTPNGIEINNASAPSPMPSAPVNNNVNNINPFSQNGTVTPVEPVMNTNSTNINDIKMPEPPVNMGAPVGGIDSVTPPASDPVPSSSVVENNPIVPPQPPIAPQPEPVIAQTPTIEPPIVNTPPIEPVTVEPTLANEVSNQVNPSIDTNINNDLGANDIGVNNNINVFAEQKEAFMQACENMFDALVQKFEKELQNRK